MITVLGIGPGDRKLCLLGTETYLKQADTVIGSPRQLALFPGIPQEKQLRLPRLTALKEYLVQNKTRSIVLLASGDPLLYGIGTWVTKNFSKQQIQIIPGLVQSNICSIAYTYQ